LGEAFRAYKATMPFFPYLRGACVAALLLLSACAGGDFRPPADLPVKIGKPYVVRGVTFVPAADPSYDMLGYASWYGRESGNRTANGERFRPDWITAAHKTLPLPTYVEVTALATGRRIVVRVNDRGPFIPGPRIIDLSRGAAERLGIGTDGHAAVRVHRIEPSEADRRRLLKGKPARDLPPESDRALASLQNQLAAAGLSLTGTDARR
jgi:rare lipoprotein A